MPQNSISMKTLALTLLCGVMTSGMALANADKGSADFMFHQMDTNGDGRISTDEHAVAAKRMFEKMDANKDGLVTAAEMDAAHEKIVGAKPGAGEMSSAEKIKKVDTNGDGQLSVDEHAAGSKLMFQMMDADKSGFITKSELEAGHVKMMNKLSSPDAKKATTTTTRTTTTEK
jgi:Ca2+-binding EF-hand superfamily protein